MSNLRIFGIIVGVLGILVTFLFYRGPKWKRSNYFLYSALNLFLIIISLNPNVLNIIRDVFLLKEHQTGRLLSLLILSNIFLFFFSFYTRNKLETLHHQFDKSIRALGATKLFESNDINVIVKPIMIIIPAYNEAENLKTLLPCIPDKINGKQVGVLVIDDGSNDGTIQSVKEAGYAVASNIINRGQGAASRLGYDILLKHNVEIGVTMDADNQHNPEDIETLIKPILDKELDLVIGSRILGSQGKNTWVRNVGIVVLSKVISLVTNVKISDCSSGFKAFNIDRIKELQLREDQFQSSEVIIESAKQGLRIGEVPITVALRKHGSSKKGTDLTYGFSFFKTILKTWWR